MANNLLMPGLSYFRHKLFEFQAFHNHAHIINFTGIIIYFCGTYYLYLGLGVGVNKIVDMLQGNERYIYFSIILEVASNVYPVSIPLSSATSSSGLKINPDMKLRDCMSAKSLL